MPFNDIVKEMAPEVVAALKVLDANGFQIFTDVRIEDCVKPDGNRRRSFSNRGRYAVGALLKNLSSRDGQELRAFPADSFEVQPQVHICSPLTVTNDELNPESFWNKKAAEPEQEHPAELRSGMLPGESESEYLERVTRTDAPGPETVAKEKRRYTKHKRR